MTKFLFISTSGESLPIAWRMQREGADVSIYLHNPRYRSNYEGLFPTKIRLASLKKATKKADTVIFDICRPNERTKEDLAFLQIFGAKKSSASVFGPVADILRRSVKVIGSSAYTEQLELDRQAGSEFAEKIGLNIPDTKRFESLQKGVSFLKGQKESWVFKPLNNEDLDLTYVEKFPGELVWKMENEYSKRLGEKTPYILQKKIDGTEISTEVWISQDGLMNFNHTLESKKLMNGNLGPSIGSQSNTVWIKKRKGLLVKELGRAAERLSGYLGPVDVNCIVDEKGTPYFLEWSPRFGWDALYCLLTLLRGGITRFFESDFRGEFEDGFASSERLTIPPFPYSAKSLLADHAKDVTILQPLEKIPSFWAQDVYQNGELKCAGADGIIGVATGQGTSIGESYGKVYRFLDTLKICADKQYRTDGAKKNEIRFNKLSKLGEIT